jgi:hypothetical protein
VRDVQDSIGKVGAETRENISEWQWLAVAERLRPALNDYGIRALAHLRNDPIAGALGAECPGNARAEVELSLCITKRCGTIELAGFWSATLARDTRD